LTGSSDAAGHWENYGLPTWYISWISSVESAAEKRNNSSMHPFKFRMAKSASGRCGEDQLPIVALPKRVVRASW
jgi:hypothetical protein